MTAVPTTSHFSSAGLSGTEFGSRAIVQIQVTPLTIEPNDVATAMAKELGFSTSVISEGLGHCSEKIIDSLLVTI